MYFKVDLFEFIADNIYIIRCESLQIILKQIFNSNMGFMQFINDVYLFGSIIS